MVDLALSCHWERSLGAMGGQVWTGVRCAEIESVLRTWRVKPRKRWRLMQAIRLFVRVACNELNERERDRADEARNQ